jgi:hypothetical protein
MGDLKNCMGSRQIVLVSTAGMSVLNAGIFWREAKTKRLFSQCGGLSKIKPPLLVQRCNGTTAGLGYLEVNVICPCKSPHWAVV